MKKIQFNNICSFFFPEKYFSHPVNLVRNKETFTKKNAINKNTNNFFFTGIIQLFLHKDNFYLQNNSKKKVFDKLS